MEARLLEFYELASARAKKKFGGADEQWTLLRFEFRDDGPRMQPDFSSKQYSIHLSQHAYTEWQQARPYTAAHEIGHEVIHTLAPVTLSDDTNLEEGVATWFANDFYEAVCKQKSNHCGDSYRKQLGLVSRMLRNNSSAIQKVRRTTPRFRDVTAEQLFALKAGLTRQECDYLVEPFPGREL